MSAVLMATGVFCLVHAVRPRAIDLGSYLDSPRTQKSRRRVPHLGARTLLVGAAAGAVVGIAAAPEQTFVAAGLGAAAATLVRRAARTTRTQRRAARLVQELPTVADTLALRVLAGESVSTAITRLTATASGVAADELQAAVHTEAGGLEEALRRASTTTVHPEAARLYDLLAHAHRTGGRLAEALAELATDYRATLARELTAEGGRRALAVYGPILALMIPVTLLFLMYPTLAGLTALSSTP
jgi:tight adherence protein C